MEWDLLDLPVLDIAYKDMYTKGYLFKNLHDTMKYKVCAGWIGGGGGVVVACDMIRGRRRHGILAGKSDIG